MTVVLGVLGVLTLALGAVGPEAEGPEADGPDAEGPEADGPETPDVDADGPDTLGPETEGPDADGPLTEGPEPEVVRQPASARGNSRARLKAILRMLQPPGREPTLWMSGALTGACLGSDPNVQERRTGERAAGTEGGRR